METNRLIFRHYQESDKTNLVALFTNDRVMEFVDNGVMSEESAEILWRKLTEYFYPKGINTIYGVFEKSDGRYLGHTAIRPRPSYPAEWEISYILKTEEWGKGYATEIGRRLIEFGLDELNLQTVYATVDIENNGSLHVLEKIGMKHIRDEYDELGKFYVYGINA